MSLFTRSPRNPIITPGERWWEARAVFNPGAVIYRDRVALVYRAVGVDGISRFGLAWSGDGERIDERSALPWYESDLDDPWARIGVEDPRITPMDGRFYLTYCKASVAPASTPPLSWEPAPFRVRSGVGVTADFSAAREIGVILPETNSKDAVLFPERCPAASKGSEAGSALESDGYAALIRLYPSIQYITSPDLREWSEPVTVMEPVPGTWEGERIGAGTPPIGTPWGWLLLYHGNALRDARENRRLYAMGLAILDVANPSRVIYRHPEPVFRPEAPYEVEGPVGNVVFGTGLVERDERLYLYYGAGDGVIGVAIAEKEGLFALLREAIGPPPLLA